MSESLVIARRFCGPTQSGNGGYVCGRLAAHVPGSAAVRLKSPPPLETELRIESGDSGSRLLDGGSVIAEARAAEVGLEPPAPPSFAEAAQAARSFSGFTHHSFPRCFVCGPQRAAGDGLRIFPGAVTARPIVAAPWVPDASLADDAGSVRREFLWAALDCTGAFALLPVPPGRAIVLGELCARIDAGVAVDEKCVTVGWTLRIDGRKHYAGSALCAESGRAVAVARATWIEVAASAFGGD
jgi:hypothetical protein